jgi:hypothetical protein
MCANQEQDHTAVPIRSKITTVPASALLNLLENSLGRSKHATRLMQAQ